MTDEPIDSGARRKLLIAMGGVAGAGALAGCTGETEGEGGEGDGPTRPTPDNINVDELDPVVTFMVRSLDYQNKKLEQNDGGG